MEGTRSRILELLRQRGQATVEDLTHVLDLAPATVRRHLDVLQRDGQVALQTVRRSTGRPHYLFSLTQAGRNRLPGHYIGVTVRVLRELLSLRPPDTNGRDGRGVALLAFERMTSALALACERRVTAARLPERLQETVEALADGGLTVEAAPAPGGYLLKVRDCPCRLADTTREGACLQAEALLRRLVGAEVRRDEGAEREVCAYFVADSREQVPDNRGRGQG